jgi:hypothetical protein
VAYVPGQSSAFSQQVPLLDVNVFQKLFNSNVVTVPSAPSHGGSLDQGENASPPGGEQEGQGTGAQGPAGGPGATEFPQSPTALPVRPVEALHATLSDAGAPVATSAAGERGNDALAALGVAGLLAGQQAHSRGRHLLDRDAMAGAAAGKAVPLARIALDAITRKWFGLRAEAQSVAESRALEVPSESRPSGASRSPARNRQSLIKW